MHRIFIRCPSTKKLIYTGFAMDAAIFHASPVEQNPIDCPACKQKHSWTKEDALFEADQQRSA